MIIFMTLNSEIDYLEVCHTSFSDKSYLIKKKVVIKIIKNSIEEQQTTEPSSLSLF